MSAEAEAEDGLAGLRRTLGPVLVGFGIMLGGWTFYQVLALIGGGRPALIDQLIPLSTAARSLTMGTERVELPLHFFTFGAYGMAVGLLSVTATMANALVRSGAALMRDGRAGRELARLRADIDLWRRSS